MAERVRRHRAQRNQDNERLAPDRREGAHNRHLSFVMEHFVAVEPLDLGAFDVACRHCGALYFNCERRDDKSFEKREFGILCCGNGDRVKSVRHLQAPPPDLVDLMRDASFRAKGVLFNNVVAFSSATYKTDVYARQNQDQPGAFYVRMNWEINMRVGQLEPESPNAFLQR